MKTKRLFIFGVVLSMLGLILSLFGAYSVSYTSKNLAQHENFAGRKTEQKPGNRGNAHEQEVMRELQYKYERDQNLAYVVLAVGILVVVAGVVCLLVHYRTRSKDAAIE